MALGAGLEANSVTVDPLIADPTNLDFTRGNATLVLAGIGAEEDEEDDAELQAYLTTYTAGISP